MGSECSSMRTCTGTSSIIPQYPHFQGAVILLTFGYEDINNETAARQQQRRHLGFTSSDPVQQVIDYEFGRKLHRAIQELVQVQVQPKTFHIKADSIVSGGNTVPKTTRETDISTESRRPLELLILPVNGCHVVTVGPLSKIGTVISIICVIFLLYLVQLEPGGTG